jgi:hypothetical protein
MLGMKGPLFLANTRRTLTLKLVLSHVPLFFQTDQQKCQLQVKKSYSDLFVLVWADTLTKQLLLFRRQGCHHHPSCVGVLLERPDRCGQSQPLAGATFPKPVAALDQAYSGDQNEQKTSTGLGSGDQNEQKTSTRLG